MTQDFRTVAMKAVGWPMLLATALLLSSEPASAAIYRWIDDQGQVHVTDNLNDIPEKYRPGAPAPPPDPDFKRATPEDIAKGRAVIGPLRTLRSVADAGATYQGYMTRLGDARIEFDRAARGMGDSSLRDALVSAMAFYQLAGVAWNARIRGENPLQYAGGPCPWLRASTESTVVRTILACAGDKVSEANALLR
jgi:hypothetical protein